MKTLSKLAINNITETQYHDMEAFSYSIIRNYATKGFGAIKTLFDKVEPTDEMRFGSLVDCMVTMGMDKAREKYAVLDSVPTESKKAVLDHLLSKSLVKNMKDCRLDNIQKIVIMAADEMDYQKRWNNDTKLKALTDEQCTRYFDTMKSGKDVVSSADWADAVKMTHALHTHPYLKDIFGKGNDGTIEFLYQAKFATDITINDNYKVHVKIMPDLLIVNHKNKFIIPVDLKTSSVPAYDFPLHWKKMRYDLQASMYTDVLRSVLADSEDFDDYKVEQYLFVDISREDMVPLAFTYDPSRADQAEGLSIAYGDSTVQLKGWRKLLNEIVFYLDNRSTVPAYIDPIEPNDILNLLAR